MTTELRQRPAEPAEPAARSPRPDSLASDAPTAISDALAAPRDCATGAGSTPKRQTAASHDAQQVA
jgi:hypothetical protein